jgi:hypothetical protein
MIRPFSSSEISIVKWSRLTKHIWWDFSKGSYTITFTSTGTYKRYFIKLSVSGADADDALTFTFDGNVLQWKSNGLLDRTFYQWSNHESGFRAGVHTLDITAGGSSLHNHNTSHHRIINKQLCHALILEYMDEDQYHMDDPNYIGIYPTYDIRKRKTVRPNNERCLMRNMTSTSFCRVCQENMWQQFLSRVECIDNVTVAGTHVTVHAIPLAQLRPWNDGFRSANPAVATEERYSVHWLKDSVEDVSLQNQFQADFTDKPKGEWVVRLTFSTPNVRLDSNQVMSSQKKFIVASPSPVIPTHVPTPSNPTSVPITTTRAC